MSKGSRWFRWILPALLLWVAGLGLWQSWNHTLTTDEAIHTASAYLALTRGDHRFDPEHPFLFKYLTALPFLVYRTNLPAVDQEMWARAEPTFYDSWLESRVWADQWVYESGNNAKAMQLLMRLPGVAVLVVLAWFSWWISRRWFGDTVAAWTLLFVAFNPTLLAHGPMTNTDVPLALAFLVVLWRLWEYWGTPTRWNAGWVGLAVSAALLTKFSAIALVPVVMVWMIATAWKRRVRWYLALADLALIPLLFWGLVWLTYFFRSPVRFTPEEAGGAGTLVKAVIGWEPPLAQMVNWSGSFLPIAYLKGLYMVIEGGRDGRAMFLLGTHYGNGQWFYFPVIFLLKTQLMALVVGAVGLGLAIPKLFRPRQWSAVTWLLLLSGGVFLTLALGSKLNLGIRHISPLMPLFAVASGVVLARLQPVFRSHFVPLLVVAGMTMPVFLQAGNLIGFGNSVTTPAREKHHFFQDSNLDWGQSWERIGKLLDKEFPGQPVYIEWYTSPLRYYAPRNTQYSAERAGSDGVGAILLSASNLNGSFSSYQRYEPAFVIDDAYFIYRSDRLVPR